MNNRQKLLQQQYLNNERAVLQQLQKAYADSLGEIEDSIVEHYESIQRITDQIAALDPDDDMIPILESRRRSKVYQKSYQEALQEQVSDILDRMQTREFVSISDYLDECYTDGFIGSIFDLHGQKIPLIMPLDQERMVRVVQLESKISQGLYTKLGEDVTTLRKKITSVVSRSMATGRTFTQCAEELAANSRIGYNKAARIARTEGHRVQTRATMDAMEQAKDRGADVVKQWDSTLDGNTRDSHRAVDGQIRELGEEFSNGLDYPGDPSGKASEVVNCRCAILQRARWALDEEELDTLKQRAEYFDLDKSEDFEDFKKKYLKATDENEKVAAYGVSNKKPIRPRKSDYANDEDYESAKAEYKRKREAFEQELEKAKKQNLERPLAFGTLDEVVEWGNGLGIAIDRETLTQADIRAFNDIKFVLEEQFKKHPYLKRYTAYSTFGDFEVAFTLDFETTNDFLMEASGGLTLGSYFMDYRNLLDELGRTDLVLGDGTIRTTIRHEIGHNLQRFINFSYRDERVSKMRRTELTKELRELAMQKLDGMSEYSTTNDQEFFAEGYAAYSSGEQTPFAIEFGKLFERWMKDALDARG